MILAYYIGKKNWRTRLMAPAHRLGQVGFDPLRRFAMQAQRCELAAGNLANIFEAATAATCPVAG
ncbi:hypothetical protein CQ13_19315 [Bradyrhizobium retamae]|uniref:Uncharacterized protein n=1 Tax=Bradyrhizobium retamae TaxID=1300035 RepID=A0A0R3NA41_9BRAD|nr:hypothetical protein CQ13_19315 [Bradyrhizobium retamae]